MNVSNRQKTTDAETPATQTSQHHHQQLLAYISCRQAATVPNKSSRSRQEEEQEQLVTSTSADSLLPLQAEGEGEEISIELETVVSSPAHITSSTHSYGIVTDSHEEEVMPSTSENARLEKDEYPIKQIHQNTNNYNHLTNTTIKEMVARDINTKTVTDVAGRGSSSLGEVGVQLQDLDNQSTSSSNKIIDSHSEKNKIILKLPKLSGCESQLISTNEDDLRKVEPLKINLHNTHHHHTANVNHTPKITIKPILEEQATDVLVSSEECSSSAEDDVISKLNNSEPHILPKLTIRAKNEDYGSSQTTVVPKLTIKINDSSATETLGTSSAANTPPLPKLTIKTGQDGQTESIITNVSPASSTTSSSSSLASSSSASLSSANFLVATSLSSASIPKLTIRPIQKSHEFKTTESNDQQPSIPKLCIKTNMLCTDVTEECTLSKIPKLTIKTGQEHAVIITQHTDNVKTTGIPKLTIKTKSLDMPDEFNISASTTVEKIPKLTIKTNNSNEVTKICRNKVQSEAVNASIDTPLTSPKHQAVPKLTISKQLSQLDKSVDILDEDVTQCCLSKRNVKSQKVSESISLSERPYSTEESGISDDPEDEDEEQVYETNKIVPKLTIKNLGSPQQKLKVVVDSDVEVKKHINSTPLSEDVDEFSDLLNVDNVCGESSNSQEFCGFNENITDCSINVQDVSIKGVSMNTEGVPEQHQTDDMDLDETLKSQHEPQMFQNLVDYNIQASSSSSTQQAGSNGNVAVIGHIIDTVDLTSSAGSSPSHRFDYNDDEDVEKRPTDPPNVANNAASAKTNILLGCLQREMTVIKNTQQLKLHIENNSVPPPLQPKPNVINKSPVSLKYPQLAERLMTNGSTVENMTISAQTANNNSGENIIDSIEILDTPEGSPRNSLDGRPENVEDISIMPNGLQDSKEAHTTPLNNNNNLNLKRHATLECNDMEGKKLTSKTIIEELPSKLRKLQKEDMCATQHNNELHQKQILNNLTDEVKTKSEMIFLNKTSLQSPIPQHQRTRKQKHENLLPIPIDEVADSIQKSSSEGIENHIEHISDRNENTTPIVKKRGRPKKSETILQSSTAKDEATPANTENRQDYKSRRVQLLRKRLAIDMVDAEQPVTKISDVVLPVESNDNNNDIDNIDTPKRDRSLRTPLRTSRRSNTPILFQTDSKTMKNKPLFSLPSENKKVPGAGAENDFNHFIESNSSISSASSSTVTSTVASMSNNVCISVVSQIDLTMSSSSSNSNGSTTNTITTVEATTRNDSVMIGNSDGSINCGIVGGNSNNSMLPPTTILSSSDPLPDVIFRPNDFSSIIATQQLREHFITEHKAGLRESQDEEIQGDVSGADNSEDESSSSSMSTTPGGRGRGRLRGARGGRSSGRGNRSHHLSRGASSTAKNIAMNRPRCVGALKHTPDPERIKGLYSPSPQVFEEDTRMSADLTQSGLQQQQSPSHASQTDFFINEESQSSVISNTSILDPNNIISAQNGTTIKKPIKKKKMEVCVAEDTDFTVASIAEYDWPPPKGCCPSKNRDTFMIQEQVAMYLGIKSFKRKYPDLPRRQVDMEERNWLQEKGLVSEKMCDLGITAVWASDILDIMYTDFYEKYEEYKDFVRQKHLREIEAKQKSLGLNVAGRGLQARERALLSTSKWNSYFNRTRKEERPSFLDLQTLIVNKPSPPAAPISTILNRPISEAVALAAKAENIAEPPTLLKPRVCEPLRKRDVYYPLSLVPGQFCEKYYDYSSCELRRMPLNTIIDPSFDICQQNDNESNNSDTDSAVESIDNKVDAETSKRYSKRRLRRTRQVENLSTDEFKIPPLPGASKSVTSSTDSCSSSDESSSETDSDSTCTSSSSETSSDDENLPSTCGVCLRPHNRNLHDVPEVFIQCYTCRRKVHPSCIEMPHRMTMRVRNYNWQCCNCKCCMKCKVNRDHNKMLFCEQCDRGFHIYCLGIKTVPDGRWSCNRCSICVRCGSSKPEGWFHSQQQLINAVNGENVKQARHKKVKWVNEYRVDHLTKVKEHISMLCVPCARMKPTRRVQIATCNNTTLNDFNSNSYNCTQSAISLRTENITTSTSSEDTCFSENKESGSHSSNNKKFHTSTTATTSATNQTATAGSPPAVA